MLIDQILVLEEYSDHSLETYPKKMKVKSMKKSVKNVAKVIGPKLDETLAKIGSHSCES